MKEKIMEEYYVDYDKLSGLWCVFNTETSKAYSSWATREQAKEDADERNWRLTF